MDSSHWAAAPDRPTPTRKGISDIRDESDREGMRIAMDLKREAVPEVVELDLGPVAGRIVDKDQMDLEMLKLKKAYQQNLAAEISGLQKQIGLLTERLERLESRTRSQAATPPARGVVGTL